MQVILARRARLAETSLNRTSGCFLTIGSPNRSDDPGEEAPLLGVFAKFEEDRDEVIVGLILLALAALVEGAPEIDQTKPLVIQDGEPAQSYIKAQLNDLLNKPAFLYLSAETPFIAKRIGSKDYWIALVEFFFGPSEQEALHGMTVILFDPATSQHQFMTPDDLVRAINGNEI